MENATNTVNISDEIISAAVEKYVCKLKGHYDPEATEVIGNFAGLPGKCKRKLRAGFIIFQREGDHFNQNLYLAPMETILDGTQYGFQNCSIFSRATYGLRELKDEIQRYYSCSKSDAQASIKCVIEELENEYREEFEKKTDEEMINYLADRAYAIWLDSDNFMGVKCNLCNECAEYLQD